MEKVNINYIKSELRRGIYENKAIFDSYGFETVALIIAKSYKLDEALSHNVEKIRNRDLVSFIRRFKNHVSAQIIRDRDRLFFEKLQEQLYNYRLQLVG